MRTGNLAAKGAAPQACSEQVVKLHYIWETCEISDSAEGKCVVLAGTFGFRIATATRSKVPRIFAECLSQSRTKSYCMNYHRTSDAAVATSSACLLMTMVRKATSNKYSNVRDYFNFSEPFVRRLVVAQCAKYTGC